MKNTEIKRIDYREIGKRIRSCRRETEMTQEQLAELAGVSTSFIGHIERGEKKASVETLAMLSEVLDMDMNYMLLGTKRNDGCAEMINEINTIISKYVQK